MTIDERLVFDLADVLAVQVECRKCGAAVSYPPSGWNAKAQTCPNCNQTWWDDRGMEFQEVEKLAGAIRALLAHAKNAGFKIRLVIPHPE